MSDQEGRQEAGRAASRPRVSPFVFVSALSLLAYWAMAALVMIVDPYDIKPWGASVTLPSSMVRPETRVLAMAVAKSPEFDLVMIGASTAVSYTPDQIRAVFPQARTPVNFSYSGARPKDRDFVTRAVAQYSAAERIVIWIDWTYMWPPEDMVSGWPAYMFDSSLSNDLRMINHEAIGASFNVLSGRPPVEASERQAESDARAWRQAYSNYQTPQGIKAEMARFRTSVRTLRPGPVRTCGDYKTLNQQLMPALRILSERRKSVDLVLPPYSVVFYGEQLGSRGYDFSSLLTFRRCLVQAAADLPGVNVWALDSNVQMISDLRNYRDPGHLHTPAALQSALAAIGDPRYRLTVDNVDAWNETLWRTVRDYQYTNSYSDPEMSRAP